MEGMLSQTKCKSKGTRRSFLAVVKTCLGYVSKFWDDIRVRKDKVISADIGNPFPPPIRSSGTLSLCAFGLIIDLTFQRFPVLSKYSWTVSVEGYQCQAI